MKTNKKIIDYIYMISSGFLILTGFAQMPIFKRYRIADIPGLGWLAQFYVTHAMHYIFAAIFTAVCFYMYTEYILNKNKHNINITPNLYLKRGLAAGLIITGVLMVLKNLSGVIYPPILISVLNISHLVLCMFFIFYSLIIMIHKWTLNNTVIK